MSIRTLLGGFSGASAPARPASDEELREARVQAARRNSRWGELDPVDLVERRGGRVLVSAETDHVYTPYRGALWATGSATPISDFTALYFTVSTDGELSFYEQQAGTWSERVARQARRGR